MSSETLHALRSGAVDFDAAAAEFLPVLRGWASRLLDDKYRLARGARCVDDLVQDGLLRLWLAVDEWDSGKGARIDVYVAGEVVGVMRMECRRAMGWPDARRPQTLGRVAKSADDGDSNSSRHSEDSRRVPETRLYGSASAVSVADDSRASVYCATPEQLCAAAEVVGVLRGASGRVGKVARHMLGDARGFAALGDHLFQSGGYHGMPRFRGKRVAYRELVAVALEAATA